MNEETNSSGNSEARFVARKQLLYEIQVHSCWHALPLASKRLYGIFKVAPLSVRAEYLVSRYRDTARQPKAEQLRLVNKVLRYPICTPAVLDLMLDLPACPAIPRGGCTELPRRLFRRLSSRPSGRWRDTDPPLPMLRYLYSHPRIPTPDSNGWDGYALTKAVAAGFMPLVRFLLEHGASPANKNGLAVHAAIRRKGLALVKLLIEPDPLAPIASSSRVPLEKDTKAKQPQPLPRPDARPPEQTDTRKRSHDDDDTPPQPRGTKKRRLEDRVAVTQEMLKTAVACDARDIVQYFVQEKSCMPDMQTVKTMRFLP
ncbi:hypothetical protein BDY19DRAFT_986105 [Irpex rosettiformis]|uniref:Uncharacterized protein n=1 Tax=Irpex rosettiformis TaxID=378272 RepID=A0ACB8TZ94_9APHY|nr:hypothetical protein BDY19DRAFT_986105 [Irpex rosettiformis]